MSIQQKIKDLENQIEALKAQEHVAYEWGRAPIICELDDYSWHLGPEAYDEMNWQDAKAWCELVGGELPPRDVLLQCFMNEDIKSEFKTEWYWSSTAFNASHAWGQSFYNGTQDFTNKSIYNCVRAVKKVKI